MDRFVCFLQSDTPKAIKAKFVILVVIFILAGLINSIEFNSQY